MPIQHTGGQSPKLTEKGASGVGKWQMEGKSIPGKSILRKRNKWRSQTKFWFLLSVMNWILLLDSVFGIYSFDSFLYYLGRQVGVSPFCRVLGNWPKVIPRLPISMMDLLCAGKAQNIVWDTYYSCTLSPDVEVEAQRGSYILVSITWRLDPAWVWLWPAGS